MQREVRRKSDACPREHRVVVPHERVEGADLRPADAELLIRVAHEAADVRSHQRDTEQTERQYACNHSYILYSYLREAVYWICYQPSAKTGLGNVGLQNQLYFN